MREVRIVSFIIDADNPGAILDSIIEDGAAAEGYSAEEYQVASNVDSYWKLKRLP